LLNSFYFCLFHAFGVWLIRLNYGWVQILDSTEKAVEHSLAGTGRANVRAMKIYSESSRTTCFQWLVIFVMTCIFIMVVLLIRVTWSFLSQLCSSFFPRFALPSWRWYWRPLWMCKTSTYVCQNRALCSKQLILSFHLAHQRKRKENKIRSKFQHSYRSPLHLIFGISQSIRLWDFESDSFCFSFSFSYIIVTMPKLL
jgi:hypothetical protein